VVWIDPTLNATSKQLAPQALTWPDVSRGTPEEEAAPPVRGLDVPEGRHSGKGEGALPGEVDLSATRAQL
jgi:hypothetical protein